MLGGELVWQDSGFTGPGGAEEFQSTSAGIRLAGIPACLRPSSRLVTMSWPILATPRTKLIRWPDSEKAVKQFSGYRYYYQIRSMALISRRDFMMEMKHRTQAWKKKLAGRKEEVWASLPVRQVQGHCWIHSVRQQAEGDHCVEPELERAAERIRALLSAGGPRLASISPGAQRAQRKQTVGETGSQGYS